MHPGRGLRVIAESANIPHRLSKAPAWNTLQDNAGNIDRAILVHDFVIGLRMRFGSQSSFMDGGYLDFSHTRRSSEFTSPAGDAPLQRFASVAIGRQY